MLRLPSAQGGSARLKLVGFQSLCAPHFSSASPLDSMPDLNPQPVHLVAYLAAIIHIIRWFLPSSHRVQCKIRKWSGFPARTGLFGSQREKDIGKVMGIVSDRSRLAWLCRNIEVKLGERARILLGTSQRTGPTAGIKSCVVK